MVIRQNATCRVDARDQGANSPEFVRAKITRVSIGCMHDKSEKTLGQDLEEKKEKR